MDLATTNFWLNLLLFVAGVAVLVKGSDWFVDGAAALAHHLRIPDMIVGLTLVSIGTSLPELATNVYAALAGRGGVAMGNVTGSNIANILLILGLAITCLGRIQTDRILFYRDTSIMLGITVIFMAGCYLFDIEPQLNRWESGVLLLLGLGYIYYLTATHRKDLVEADHDLAAHAPVSRLGVAALLILGGGLFVILGAKLMVDTVVWAAEAYGVPDAVISATVVAFGTSVPELAVTVAGILKKKSDIAMGNIIGSNIFNIALVMAVTGLIAPVEVGPSVRTLVLPAMLLSSVLLMFFMYTTWALKRWEGVLMLLAYVAFLCLSFGLLELLIGPFTASPPGPAATP